MTDVWSKWRLDSQLKWFIQDAKTGIAAGHVNTMIKAERAVFAI